MAYIKAKIWPSFTFHEQNEFITKIAPQICFTKKTRKFRVHWIGQSKRSFAKIATALAIWGRNTVEQADWYKDLKRAILERLDKLPKDACRGILNGQSTMKLITLQAAEREQTGRASPCQKAPTEQRKKSDEVICQGGPETRSKVITIK